MTTLSLPVSSVVVMEDRAQVERKGELSLASGLQRFEVEGLPPMAVDRSLRVEVNGAALVDAKLLRRWRERPKRGLAADASELRQKVRALERDVEQRGDALSRLRARREILNAARAEVLRSIQESAGAGTGDPAAWKSSQDAVTVQLTALAEEERSAVREQARTQERLGEAKAALETAEEGEQDLECRLSLTVEGSGPARIRVSYLVPCAVWRPAYRATLRGGTVLLESEAVVWQRTGEVWKEVELSFSTARPTLGTKPPSLSEDRLALRNKEAFEKKVLEVAVREESIPTSGEAGGEAELPGLDDGGEARLLKVAGRFTVPSDGQPHRLPLASLESKAELEKVCPAELSPLVHLMARFPNTGGQVLLAGPVDLVRESGFVGRTQLKFAAPGEVVKLSFGSEDGLRVERRQEQKTDEARLTGKRTTKKTITHFISNSSSAPAKLVVEERVPVSELKEVEVEVLGKECSPAPGPVSKEGVARLELQLPPHGTAKATLVWALTAAGKVVGV